MTAAADAGDGGTIPIEITMNGLPRMVHLMVHLRDGQFCNTQ